MARGGYRPGAGRPKGSGTKAKKAEAKALPAPADQPKAARTETTVELLIPLPEDAEPLDYLLHVMRDRGVEPERRDRAAIAALPYVHARKAPANKKDEAAERARQAHTGRFSAPPPPSKFATKH